jgi:hypothetical protein
MTIQPKNGRRMGQMLCNFMRFVGESKGQKSTIDGFVEINFLPDAELERLWDEYIKTI